MLGAPVLVAVTLAVLVLLGVRAHYEPALNRDYIVWNLFLAWIPYVCARALWRLGARAALAAAGCCPSSRSGSRSCRTRPTS